MSEIHYGGDAAQAKRPLIRSMWRGFLCRCPNCGEGRLFGRFLKVKSECSVCAEAFHHHRADDLPAYLVIFIVGHIVIAGFMSIEMTSGLGLWQHLAIWVPLTIVGSIVLLQPVKGAVVGLQWALHMHGFGGEKDILDDHPEL
jgi:uncharacterized protein (DUF983 family)